MLKNVSESVINTMTKKKKKIEKIIKNFKKFHEDQIEHFGQNGTQLLCLYICGERRPAKSLPSICCRLSLTGIRKSLPD